MQNDILKFKNYFLFTLFIFTAFFCVNGASAFTIEKFDDQVENRFVVSPARIDYNLAAGDSINIEMLVVNRLGKREDFSIETGSLGNDDNTLSVEETKSWFDFETKGFSLDQGERARFNVTINVPNDAKSSGYYQSILVRTKGEEVEGKDQIKVVSQIGVPVFMTVGGEGVLKQARVASFLAEHFFYRNGPVKFISSVENQGNVHLQLGGEISIYNLTGAKIGQLPLKEWILLPGAKDEQVVMWTKKWLLGRYRADARFFYGDGNVLGASYIFYAFPWHILLIIILIIVVLYFLMRYLHSKYEIKVTAEKKDIFQNKVAENPEDADNKI